MSSRPVPYIDDTDGLAALCERAQLIGRIGLDTEFVRERTYYPRLALVQASVGEEIALIDPLSDRVDLAPLDDLLADPTVSKVLHAATQDLEIFALREGVTLSSIFDTQIAAALVGIGAQVGYGALCGELLEVEIDKASQYTDWLRRPLSPKQERYAAEDVRWLLPLQDALTHRLAELDRLGVMSEECARLLDTDQYLPDPAQAINRVKARRGLGGQELAVLQRLAAWREREAQRRDLPRRWVVQDDTLVAMAREAPTNAHDMAQIRGLHPREAKRSTEPMVEAIRAGLADPPMPTPKARPRRLSRSELDSRSSLAIALLKTLCEEESICSTVVATTEAVEQLVEAFASDRVDELDSRLLEGWRREQFGERILEFLEGRAAIHLSPSDGSPVLTSRKDG